MTHLIPQLQNTIAGAVAQGLSDNEIRTLVMAIVDDVSRELDTAAAADYLNKSCATLKRWRALGTGPRYRRDSGGSISYRIGWLREYQNEGVIEG